MHKTLKYSHMKNLVVMSAAVLLFMAIGAIRGTAQEPKKEKKSEMVPLKKLEGTKVSDLAKDQFIADFGNIPDVQWNRTKNFDEAIFTKNGKKLHAWYDFDNKLVGTTSIVTFADLPAEGQKNIKAKYKDYSIGPVIFFDDNEMNATDMILYDKQFDDADNYFVELSKAKEKIILIVNTLGEVSFFKQL
jgi:hypothetical protein